MTIDSRWFLAEDRNVGQKCIILKDFTPQWQLRKVDWEAEKAVHTHI